MTFPTRQQVTVRIDETWFTGFSRYPEPSAEHCCPGGTLDLPAHIDPRAATAFHEAGHFVLSVLHSVHVPAVRVDTEPAPSACAHPPHFAGANEDLTIQLTHHSPGTTLTVLAGGARAETRWLLEMGLDLTNTQAWVVELGGMADQHAADCVLSHHNAWLEHGTGRPGCDYWLHGDVADLLLAEHWDKVQTVAATLLARDRLTGDELAVLIGLQNSSPAG
ncbi:hypothetical protein [Streptomyces atratus]|uniref:hypothetical protein n=1 Tax=Streptomyces atratus TaxID=1893 RepID=UPI002255DF77|nr:hypothetical protein [Streptomyces atratus]MCX5346107.1 hypothetical protein [Streptomyces atratus]